MTKELNLALMKKSKNWKMLGSFMNYCLDNPDMRFWQALRNWAQMHITLRGGINFVMLGNSDAFGHMCDGRCPFVDTFYFTDKDFK